MSLKSLRSHSVERGTPPSTPSSAASERAPRSSTKTPRLRQRVFASLERQADKMINLLTPRKIKSSTPEVLKQTKVCRRSGSTILHKSSLHDVGLPNAVHLTVCSHSMARDVLWDVLYYAMLLSSLNQNFMKTHGS